MLWTKYSGSVIDERMKFPKCLSVNKLLSFNVFMTTPPNFWRFKLDWSYFSFFIFLPLLIPINTAAAKSKSSSSAIDGSWKKTNLQYERLVARNIFLKQNPSIFELMLLLCPSFENDIHLHQVHTEETFLSIVFPIFLWSSLLRMETGKWSLNRSTEKYSLSGNFYKMYKTPTKWFSLLKWGSYLFDYKLTHCWSVTS